MHNSTLKPLYAINGVNHCKSREVISARSKKSNKNKLLTHSLAAIWCIQQLSLSLQSSFPHHHHLTHTLVAMGAVQCRVGEDTSTAHGHGKMFPFCLCSSCKHCCAHCNCYSAADREELNQSQLPSPRAQAIIRSNVMEANEASGG